MPVLLQIDSSPQRFSRSISRQVTAAAAKAWHNRNPDGVIRLRDLNKTPLLPLGQAWVDGRDLPSAERSEEEGFAVSQSDELVQELLEADVLLIGAPMHNFNVPAVLKLWLDHVIRSERTVRFGSQGIQGLLTIQRAVVVIASGGNFGPEARAHALDFETPYLEFVLRSMGIRDVCIVPAYNTAAITAGEEALQHYLQPLQQRVTELLGSGIEDSSSLLASRQETLCSAAV